MVQNNAGYLGYAEDREDSSVKAQGERIGQAVSDLREIPPKMAEEQF